MVPRSRLQPLLGAGHAPHSDAPDAILGLVGEATAAASSAKHEPGRACTSLHGTTDAGQHIYQQ
jgi:hypothetical protein